MKAKAYWQKVLSLVLIVMLLAALAGCSSTKGSNTAITEQATGTALSSSSSTQDDDNAVSNSTTFRTLSEIQSSGKVIFGVYDNSAPFGYTDEDGFYRGYDIYFAERIATDLGVSVEYVPVEPAQRLESLEAGNVDIVLASLTVTPERAERVDFALPYMKVSLGVVSHRKSEITEAEQLNGKTLIVVKGTTAESYFTENYPDVELLKFDKHQEAYDALVEGRGDAFSTDNTKVYAWVQENTDFRVGIPSLGELDTIAPAVAKGNTSLLDWINTEIVSLGEESFFHAAYWQTLRPVYGVMINPDTIVVEGGVVEGGGMGEVIKLVVGASPVPHAEILNEVKPLLAEKFIDLEVVVFDDYIQPNQALQNGELDANFFQHRPYLNQFNASYDTTLKDIGDIHYEPMGLYAGKSDSILDLAEGATIAIPSDLTNVGRSLLLLQDQGLIMLRNDVGLDATVDDIAGNPKNISFMEIEAAQVSKSLQDVDFAVINGNYALEAGLSAYDALALESRYSLAAYTFANVIAVRAGDENRPELIALVKALQSNEIYGFITDKYSGAAMPSF